MEFKSKLDNYIHLFYTRVAELKIDDLYLDALLHAPCKGARPTEEEFLHFCFFRLCRDVSTDVCNDLNSTHPDVKRRAVDNLSPATVAELRLLGYHGRRLVARCKACLEEDRTIRRLHLKLFYRLREDLQGLMARYNTANFEAFLEEGVGPQIQDLVSMCKQLNEEDKERNRRTDD